MTQKYLRIILGIIIVIAAPIAYWAAKNPGSERSTVNQLLSSKYAVKEVGDKSFGSLATAVTAGGRGGDSSGSAEIPQGQGSAGISMRTTPAQPGVGGGTGDSKIVPPYIPEEYRFKYVGDDLTNLAAEQPVYKRVKENISTSIIDRVIRTLSLGLIDLSTFQNTKLENFTFSENQEFGYTINVDVTNGSLGIYQNYNRWPQPLAECVDEDCFLANQPKLKDIPPDNEVIDIAEKFIADKQISLNGYSRPRVINNWRGLYEAADDKANFFFPEVIDVVYPLVIDEQEVFDEGGSESGLHINVSIREKRVVGLYDLSTRQYERSDYAGETNSKRIVDLAEQGGFRSYPNPEVRGAKVVNLELLTPTRQVMRMWRFDKNQSEEIFVPALVFPIKNSGNFWRKNIIVPLVKEILDNDPQPPVTIMKGDGGATEPGIPEEIAPLIPDVFVPEDR